VSGRLRAIGKLTVSSRYQAVLEVGASRMSCDRTLKKRAPSYIFIKRPARVALVEETRSALCITRDWLWIYLLHGIWRLVTWEKKREFAMFNILVVMTHSKNLFLFNYTLESKLALLSRYKSWPARVVRSYSRLCSASSVFA
jgi:hypothetical protein